MTYTSLEAPTAFVEALPVAHPPAVDEHGHVLAQVALLVEDVAARLRLRGEHLRQHRAQRPGGDLGFRAVHMPLQVGSEHDAWHGAA